jgi:hypothetical protein
MASSSLLLLLLSLLLLLLLLLPLSLLGILRALLLFAGVLLTGDSSLLFSRDLSFSFLQLGVLFSSCCCALYVATDVGLGDGLLTLRFSLSPSREREGGSRRCLPGELTAGISSRDRLDDDVVDPADSPVPWVSLLLTPFFMVPTASGSASPNSSYPG